MRRFIIMFHDGDMQVADHEWEQVGKESHAVVAEAKAAGVWAFGGGFMDVDKPSVVTESGEVTPGPLREASSPIGGFSVITVETEAQAFEWAAKIASSCRCPQEVREMIWDDESTN